MRPHDLRCSRRPGARRGQTPPRSAAQGRRTRRLRQARRVRRACPGLRPRTIDRMGGGAVRGAGFVRGEDRRACATRVRARQQQGIRERLAIAGIIVRHHLTTIFAKIGAASRAARGFIASRHGLAPCRADRSARTGRMSFSHTASPGAPWRAGCPRALPAGVRGDPARGCRPRAGMLPPHSTNVSLPLSLSTMESALRRTRLRT